MDDPTCGLHKGRASTSPHSASRAGFAHLKFRGGLKCCHYVTEGLLRWYDRIMFEIALVSSRFCRSRSAKHNVLDYKVAPIHPIERLALTIPIHKALAYDSEVASAPDRSQHGSAKSTPAEQTTCRPFRRGAAPVQNGLYPA